jgi:hypothetical protein
VVDCGSGLVEDAEVVVALIGFIGVVAGSLLTGWLNHRAEKGRRRLEARVAAQLIAAELDIAAIKIKSAIKAHDWWPGELPTEQWRANGPALAREVESELLEELAATYTLLETWVLERRGAGAHGLPANLLGELSEHQSKVGYLATRLKDAVPAPLSAKAPNPIPILGGAIAISAVIVAIGALGYAVLVPRAETTDASIATALEQELPGKETVYCSHNADRWYCHVSYPKQRRGGCQVAQTKLQSTSSLVSQPTGNGGGSCRRSTTAKLPTSYEVGAGDDGLIASPRVNEALRKELSKRIQSPPAKELETDKTSLVTRMFRSLKGE